MVVGPVLVTVEPPRTMKLAAEPRIGVADAWEGTEKSAVMTVRTKNEAWCF